jgi:hypothetical protein
MPAASPRRFALGENLDGDALYRLTCIAVGPGNEGGGAEGRVRSPGVTALMRCFVVSPLFVT